VAGCGIFFCTGFSNTGSSACYQYYVIHAGKLAQVDKIIPPYLCTFGKSFQRLEKLLQTLPLHYKSFLSISQYLISFLVIIFVLNIHL
jgi:hypothetical protein